MPYWPPLTSVSRPTKRVHRDSMRSHATLCGSTVPPQPFLLKPARCRAPFCAQKPPALPVAPARASLDIPMGLASTDLVGEAPVCLRMRNTFIELHTPGEVRPAARRSFSEPRRIPAVASFWEERKYVSALSPQIARMWGCVEAMLRRTSRAGELRALFDEDAWAAPKQQRLPDCCSQLTWTPRMSR